MTVRARGKEIAERTDAKETRGTRHGHSEHVFGACVVYLGEMSNGELSLRVGSQEGDVGSWRHGDENRQKPPDGGEGRGSGVRAAP